MLFLQKLILLFKIGIRNIIRQKRRSIVVSATALVGIFSVILSQGFMNGMFDSMVSLTIESGLGHVQIRPAGFLESRESGMIIQNPELVEKQFKDVIGNDVFYAPRMEREAILRIGSDVKGVLLLGIDPDREKNVSTIPDWIATGSNLTQKKNSDHPGYECILGMKNAEILELETGDWFVLTTGASDGTNKSFRCNIKGIFHSPVASLDEFFIIMRLSDLIEIRESKNSFEVSYFVFQGKKLEDAESIKNTIISGVNKNEKTYRTLEVLTYNDMEPAIADLFELQDQFTWIFYFIILLGFGIVLFESITMSIFERTREIGIIHAIGTRPYFLFWMVIFEAFTLTMIGVFASAFLSSIVIYFMGITGVDFGNLSVGDQVYGKGIGKVYPYITLQNLLQIFYISVIISFFSGIYPAWKAVKISPLKAIYQR